MSAVRLGLFDALADGPRTDAELAQRMQASVRGTAMLAEAMAAMGLVARSTDGLTALTPFAQSRLVSSSPESACGLVEHMRELLAEWAELDRAVKDGGLPRRKKGPARHRAFLGGMAAGALLQAEEVAAKLDLSGKRRLLDAGGAVGAWSCAFLKHNPNLTAVNCDLPKTREAAEQFAAGQGLAGRLAFHACDLLEDRLPGGFDAAWVSQVLHIYGPENVLGILRKIYAALEPGGLLLVHEILLGGGLFPALFALNMLTHTEEGRTWKEDDLMALMREAGFHNVRRLPLELSGGRGILTGTKD